MGVAAPMEEGRDVEQMIVKMELYVVDIFSEEKENYPHRYYYHDHYTNDHERCNSHHVSERVSD